MERKRLGRTGIEVSRIGLGCVTFGREIDEAASFRLMDYALEKGINFFDTAESYGGGQAREYRRRLWNTDDIRETGDEFHSSEKIIGRWIKARGCRKLIVLETKVYSNFSHAHVVEALDASLERLQTDRIDSYLFHTFDTKTPLEESLEAMTTALRSGKICAAGCSNFGADQLRMALKLGTKYRLARMEVIQPHYNLLARDIENELLPLCRQEDVSVVGYSPLAAGFLSGKYTAERNAVPKGTRFDVVPDYPDLFFTERNFRLLDRLREMAERTGIPMARLALGWVLQHRDLTSTLIGARTPDHIDNAVMALKMEFPEEWRHEMSSWN